ncbi:hypothetical protein ACB092_06G008000 [Castanea dentata]
MAISSFLHESRWRTNDGKMIGKEIRSSFELRDAHFDSASLFQQFSGMESD